MTLPLPVVLKAWLRPLPQWPPIALQAPQQAVRVGLTTARGTFDVTGAAVVASLRPFTLALGLEAQLLSAIAADAAPRLQFVDLESGRTVGALQLQHLRNWATSGATIGLFEVRDGTQRCLHWPHRTWNRWLQNRRMRANTDPNNFFMPPAAVQQQMIFYICPRPVVLVSVDDGAHSNLFPMDLIGPISADHFTLALRSTSPSIAAMKSARCVALSDVPAREFATAYKLGIHHKHAKVNWEALPFRIERSRNLSLPCPAIALRVRELAILDFDTIGSHTFFVGRIVSDLATGEGSQFFHTSGIYQYFRTRQARPFPACH
ncbi:MAG TPA: flavin reductase [Steroidobacteraceae bacterium]|nr:flavin reductase [Steroidobacteraceae bacterium]